MRTNLDDSGKDFLIKAEDYSNTSILLTFASSEKRILDINHIFNIRNDPHLSKSIKQRWKIMYDKGDFFYYKICTGDLIFKSWVEIFADDLKKQTINFERYNRYQRSKRLFVHYGCKHFDKEQFSEAKNREFFETQCDLQRDSAKIDFDMLKKEGFGDGFPLYAIETTFEDYNEYSECLMGYDCDSVIVLNDSILIENYDAKSSKNQLVLEDLMPSRYFKNIREDVSVSCLLRSPDNKVYVYVEEPDDHYGFKMFVACISDGRIVEICGYTEDEALGLIDEIKQYKEELEHILIDNRVFMVW